MYWPSTPDDGEFAFRYSDTPFLDPDTVLATYTDWRDIRFCDAPQSLMYACQGESRIRQYKSKKSIFAHPEQYHVDSAIKLGDYNIGRAGNILTLPLYMAFVLREHRADDVSSRILKQTQLICMRIMSYALLKAKAENDLQVSALKAAAEYWPYALKEWPR